MPPTAHRLPEHLFHRLGLSPYVRFAAHPIRDSWKVGRRILRDYLLFHVVRGKGRLILEGEKIPLEPGGWYWVPPAAEHILEGVAPPRMEVPYVHFDLVYDPSAANLPMAPEGFLDRNDPAIQPDFFRGILRGRVEPAVFGAARDSLNRIIELFGTRPPGYSMVSSGFLLLLVANIYEGCFHERDSSALQAVGQVEKELAEPGEEQPTMRKLSDLTGYNPKYLGRLFKQLKGVSSRQYVRQLKINRAKDLLRYSNKSLTAIAEEAGFSSLQVFSRTFRKMEGVTPTEFLRGGARSLPGGAEHSNQV